MLAFELAKSANCYTDVVYDLYQQLSEFPHFALIVKARTAAATTGGTVLEAVDTVEQYKQCIEHFCDLYFKKSMNLNGYNLSGVTAQYLTTFPKVLLKCTFLEQLDLSHNDLTELPPEIGTLRNLRLLNLSANPRLRALPEELGQLQRLERLDLSGIPDLFQVVDEQQQSHYPFPAALRPLQQLRHLNLQDIQVDYLPDWIHEWPYLESLHLFSGCKTHPELQLPKNFTRLRRLKTLTIDSFSVRLPEHMQQLTALECLVVNHALYIPSSIAQLRQLKYLDLSYFGAAYPLVALAGKTVGDLTEADISPTTSRLSLLGWEWLLEMPWLEELVCKHQAPWAFTKIEMMLLQKALPHCHLSID